MRKLVVSNLMSLDGHIEGPGGDVTALPMDAFFDAYNLERLHTSDTLLLGAKTYMGLKGYWPAVAENPELSPAVAIDASTADLHRETGRRNNEIQKVVVSDTLTGSDTAPWTETTTIIPRSEVDEYVMRLKSLSGHDILTFGSRTLWNHLLGVGLVDELHLMVGAAVLGGGKSAFITESPIGGLQLVNTLRREDSENVLLVYEVADQEA